MTISLKLKFIFTIFFLLNLIIFTKNNAAAENDYAEALLEILKVYPDSNIEAELNEEEDESEVEFSKDMKFLNITLKDSIYLALQNNYDIKIARLEPIIKEKDITAAKSVFDPVLEVTGKTGDSEIPSNSQLQIGFGDGILDFRYDTNTLEARLKKLLETGATFSLEFNMGHTFLDPAPFVFIHPFSDSSIEAKVTQPLLKNAGIFYNRSNIHIARNDKKKSILQLKSTTIDIIDSVQKAYWNLVKAIEDLRVRNKSLERAKDLLKKNKIQVEVGTMAPIEVLEAEEGVASQLEAVIVAENEIKNKEDDLKKVMNLQNNSVLSDVSIVPLNKAATEYNDVSLDESIKAALENRPELFEQNIDMENNRITVQQRKNELLPKFDFEAGIRYNGLARNYGNSIDSTLSQDFQSEFFGVTLEVPIGNREARSNYSKAKSREKQSILNTKKVEQDIIVEVRKAVRQINTNTERIKATTKALELAQKRLDAEGKKFKVGRSTSLEVIRAQEDLAVAEGNATKAKVDYQISLGELDATQGISLKKNNIIIDEHNL